ncbi:MAG: helix-turn-helix domain-containing protein [Robiginitomaculum sp.]|nr:helix-turn-helix domain-containing protein [Robiginitomaculum sp.]
MSPIVTIGASKIFKEFSIGEIAKAIGTNVQTIRYYEKRKLLAEPLRNASDHRVYSIADRDRLAFIRHARILGFSLAQTSTLLQLADQPEMPCEMADKIVQENLEKVRQRIAALRDLESELNLMLSGNHRQDNRECRVIETLADHLLCKHQQHKTIREKGFG